MKWEELTGDRFAAAAEECQGVCLVALSVIERHGHHLPTGTDMYTGREILRRAGLLEPVVEFPDFYFTQILEARHRVGTISIDGDLMLRLLDNVCREIARNGLKKIVLVMSHGGNRSLMPFFAELQLQAPRDYAVYLVDPIFAPAVRETVVPWERAVDGHAGPGETSHILACHPELVHIDQIPATDEWKSRARLRSLREAGVQSPIAWYADHPTHYAGDAGFATAEAGDRLFDAMAQVVVKAVRAIKADDETKRLLDEFYATSLGPKA